MRKNKVIDFTRKTRKRSPVLVVVLICTATVLLGGVSFVVLLAKNDYDLQKFFGTRSEEKTTQENKEDTSSVSLSAIGENDTTGEPENAEKLNLLYVCYDTDKNVTFCVLTSLDFSQNTIKIKPYSRDFSLEYRGGTYTLNDLFVGFSAGALCEALTRKGVQITRFVTVDETNFKMIMQKLGAVTIKLDREINYKVDAITYTLEPGIQKLTSDALLKFMKYAGQGDELLSLQGQAFAGIVSCHFTKENIARGEEFFAAVINLTNSNITAFDYTEIKTKLCAFLDNAPEISVIG